MEGYLALIKEQREENDKLQQKVEQLENIRKEVIEFIKKYQRKDEFLNLNEWQSRDLLSILNKGSEVN